MPPRIKSADDAENKPAPDITTTEESDPIMDEMVSEAINPAPTATTSEAKYYCERCSGNATVIVDSVRKCRTCENTNLIKL